MDGQQYLNQISESVKLEKKSNKKKSFLSPKILMIGGAVLAALVIIIIIGAALGGNKVGEKGLLSRLILHAANTSEVVEEYQPNVKSSVLRSDSASLYGILSNVNKESGKYLEEKYGLKVKDIDKKLSTAADAEKDGLSNELFEAKINGILDRIFAHKMAYEITIIRTEEAKIIDVTKNEAFKEFLTESYESLGNLYDRFNDFSETK